MFKIAKFSLCVLVILGFAVTTSSYAFMASEYAVAWSLNQEKKEIEEKEASEIKELRIRNSGFRSRSSVIIRYRDKDKKIVAVIENGKELPGSEFGRYESILHEILELPQINKLLPEMDAMWRELEASELTGEEKYELTRDWIRDLQKMKSERAWRYREAATDQLLDSYYRAIERLSSSEELSQQEKIQKLKDTFRSLQEAEEFNEQNRKRSAALVEFQVAEAARRLMTEINKSSDISNEEKLRELKEIYQQVEQLSQTHARDRRHAEIAAIELYNAAKQRWQEIALQEELSEQEKRQEYERLLQEFNEIKSESVKRMLGVEKFKLDLHELLKKEGFFPEGEAEFVLKKHECTIAGKKLPKDLHAKILYLCQESLKKEFTKDTKIVLQLNTKEK